MREMTLREAFTSRLRRQREWNGISLDEISATTRIKRQLLEALERNDLSDWPRGLYARACIRAYAIAIGFDPNETVDEFCRLYPQGDRRAQPTIEEIAAIVASPSEYKPDLPDRPEGERRQAANGSAVAQPPSWLDHAFRFVRARFTSRSSVPDSAR
ncbi:MAG: helix-turn-helix transcriptional regulator [Vicinamibacterales bacterium]